MLPIPIPENEIARLEALCCYGILDSEPSSDMVLLTKVAAEICDCPVSTITLIDENRGCYYTKVGLDEDVKETPREISLCGHVVFHQQTMIISDTLQDNRFNNNPRVLDDPPLRFYAGVPLINKDGYALGTLCVIDRAPKTLSLKQVKMLEMLRDVIVQRLESDYESLKRTEKLSYQATHDVLTGLVNRFEFERRLDRVFSESVTDTSEHVLCYMDLDNFKQVNDSFGHISGDYLLQEIGQLLGRHIRKRDTLARIGGDEFGLIMEHCSIKQAQRVAKNLIKTLNKTEFDIEGNNMDIGISIGITLIDTSCDNMIELLKKVDQACYSAKKEGRNRIHIS